MNIQQERIAALPPGAKSRLEFAAMHEPHLVGQLIHGEAVDFGRAKKMPVQVALAEALLIIAKGEPWLVAAYAKEVARIGGRFESFGKLALIQRLIGFVEGEASATGPATVKAWTPATTPAKSAQENEPATIGEFSRVLDSFSDRKKREAYWLAWQGKFFGNQS